MRRALGGILVPAVTPFDPRSGDVALDGFVANLQAHLSAGVDGVVVTGSTGEAALLEESERFLLVETARRIIPPDRWLIAGIGGESTRVTVQRSRDAAGAGADAVLVVSPHYYTKLMTSDALRGHFLRVADASSVPVLLYNIPVYAHFALHPDLVAELATHENIAGMKDSAGDLEMLRQYVTVQSPRFTVLTGNGPTFAPALALGVKGGILALALFAYDSAREILDASARGDSAHARRVQERVSTAAREIVGVMGVPAVKAAMEAIGLRGGPPRSPLMPLTDPGRARVLELLRGVAEVSVA
jgi:4-hydroxy-2-oxoglutarate aldolase